jgi:tetratricopeptide (TPR) repeat protein
MRHSGDTILLCGSGVSVGSGLPDGQTLARMAFDLIWEGSKVYPGAAATAVHDALRWPDDGEPQLRLELILDLMSKHVPAQVLAGVYSVVLGAPPCLAHFTLAATGFPIVTTNQDELVEQASLQLGTGVDVLHLHGLAARPESIVTMLSQYVDGLPAPTARAMQERVAGNHLVVLGYSGRDLDVMPHLYGAARVTWLHFQPGSGPPPATEVRALQATLGHRMRIVSHPEPTGWLLYRLPATVQLAVTTAAQTTGVDTRRADGLTSEPRAAFRRVKLIQRRLAVARVLLHLGQAAAAYEGLLRATRSHPRDPQLQLMIADALVLLQRRPAALRRYARVAAMAADPEARASALLSSAHARANIARYDAAMQELGQAREFARDVASGAARQHLEAWIAVLEARIHAVTDDEDAAWRLYNHVASLAGRMRDLDLRTTALVFGSDLLRSKGRYHQALARLACVFDDNELYGRPYTRIWGRFYRGEILCAMGRLHEGLTDLEVCRANAGLHANHQAAAWAALALASYRRCSNLDAAQEHINDCEEAMTAYGSGMLLCDVRLAWERAEFARAGGQLDEALRRVAALRQRLGRSSFPAKLPYMTAHILALEGEVARCLGDNNARVLLTGARNLYNGGGWSHYVARMDVSLWLMTGRPSPPSGLLQLCRNRSYAAEVEYLTGPRRSYYPLHGL